MTLQFDQNQMTELISAMAQPAPISMVQPIQMDSPLLGVSKKRVSSLLEELKKHLMDNPELLKMSGNKAAKWLRSEKNFKVTPQYINKAKKQLN